MGPPIVTAARRCAKHKRITDRNWRGLPVAESGGWPYRFKRVQFRSALGFSCLPMLRVTKLTDYATVVLTVLAARGEQVLSASELAEHAGLEAPTVSKILKPLSQAGLVEGLRGVHGGYRLARAASDITLVEIVEAMEGPLAITECSQDHSQCGIAQTCGVRSNWRLINDVVADALRRVTLEQMLQPLSLPGDSRRRSIAARVATT